MCFLEKCLFRSSAHFLIEWFGFFWYLSCMSSLCILETNPSLSSVIYKYFLPVHRLSFCFMVSFAVQKLLSLIRSRLFVFVSVYLGDRSRKIMLQFMSKSVLLMFSSKSFIVSGLTFRFLIHSDLIFAYSVREFSNIVLLQVNVQFSWYHLVNRLSFLYCRVLSPLL